MLTRKHHTIAIAAALAGSFIATSALAKSYRAYRNSGFKSATKSRTLKSFAPRITVTKGGMCKVAFRAIKNSKIKKAWSYVDVKKADPAIQACHAGLMTVLRGGATPAFGIALFDPGSGAKVSQTQSAKGRNAKIKISGFKGKTLDAILLLPTSAHGGLNPDTLVKAGQSHTVWVNQNNNTTPGSGKMVVGGAGAKGWVTVVQAKIPVKQGKNYLLFDPKPGSTAGVGGFAEGRTIEFDIN